MGLSSSDRAILAALFDAEGNLSQPAQLSSTPDKSGRTSPNPLREQEESILKPLDVAEPTLSSVRLAIDSLSLMIRENPTYASAYVNRAQAARLLVPAHQLFTASHAHDISCILSDLTTAIALLPRPASGIPADLSAVLASAHTHRGFLLLKAADMKRAGDTVHGMDDVLSQTSSEELEDMAGADFRDGARCGGDLAGRMAVATNPYAKLCGEIVHEAIAKECGEADWV